MVLYVNWWYRVTYIVRLLGTYVIAIVRHLVSYVIFQKTGCLTTRAEAQLI